MVVNTSYIIYVHEYEEYAEMRHGHLAGQSPHHYCTIE